MGPGTGVKVKLSNVNVGPVSVKRALVMSKLEKESIFRGATMLGSVSIGGANFRRRHRSPAEYLSEYSLKPDGDVLRREEHRTRPPGP